MRLDCEQAEAAVSFTRRVLHGRLDLLASEVERRREPRPPTGPRAAPRTAPAGTAPGTATGGTAPGPAGEAPGAPLAELLERLRGVLVAQRWPAGPRARRVVLTPAPDCVQDDLLQLVDDVAGPAVLTELGGQSDAQVAEVRSGLQRLEQELSVLRRELHVAIDALQGEVRRRYRRGDVSLDHLLE